MDKALRNTLRSAITDCRKLLEEDYSRQLEGYYGVHADGHIESFDKLPHLDSHGQSQRQAIEAAINHEESSGADPQNHRPCSRHKESRASGFDLIDLGLGYPHPGF